MEICITLALLINFDHCWQRPLGHHHQLFDYCYFENFVRNALHWLEFIILQKKNLRSKMKNGIILRNLFTPCFCFVLANGGAAATVIDHLYLYRWNSSQSSVSQNIEWKWSAFKWVQANKTEDMGGRESSERARENVNNRKKTIYSNRNTLNTCCNVNMVVAEREEQQLNKTNMCSAV